MAKVANNKRPFMRWTAAALVAVFALFGVLWIGIHTTAFQTYLGKRVGEWLTERGGYSVGIEAIQIDGFRRITAVDFTLLDSKSGSVNESYPDTLIYVHQIELIASFLNISADYIPLHALSIEKVRVVHELDQETHRFPLEDWLQNITASAENTSNETRSAPAISLDRLNVFDANARLHVGFDSTGAPSSADMHQLALTASDLYWDGVHEARVHLEGFQVEANTWGKLGDLSGYLFVNSDAIQWNEGQFSFREARWRGSVEIPKAHLSGDPSNIEIWIQTEEAFFSNDLISPFYSEELPPFTGRASGIVSGSVNNGLTWESAKLEIDSALRLSGRFYWSADAWGGDAMHLRLAPRWSRYVDGLMDPNWTKTLQNIQELSAEGMVRIQGDAGVVDAELRTSRGSADVQLDWAGMENLNEASYKGRVSLVDVPLGEWIDDPKMGRVGLSLEIDGRGLTPESFDFELEGILNEFNYNDFVITGAQLDGRARDESFTGIVSMQNEWVEATYNGSLGWDSIQPYLKSTLEVERLDLIELGWDYEDSIALLRASLYTDLVFGPDGFPEGELSIRNLDLETSSDYHHLDSLDFTAHTQGDSASLAIASAWFNLGLEGRFRWHEVPLALQSWFGGQFGLMNSSRPIGTQRWSARGMLVDVEPLTRVILPQLRIEPQSHFQIAFNEAEQLLEMEFTSEGVSWDNFRFSGLEVDLRTDLNSHHLAGTISTDSTDLAGIRKWHYANYKVEVKSDTLFNTISWQDFDRTMQKGLLHTYFTMDSSESVIGWKDSQLDIVGRDWRFRPGELRFGSAGLYLSNLFFYSGQESIAANGPIQSPEAPLHIQTTDLNLNWVNLITKSRYGVYRGAMSLNMNLYQGEVQPYALGTMDVDSFIWNGVPTGDLAVRLDWEEELQAIAVVADWTLKGHRYLYAAGAYYPTSPSQRVNLQLQLDSFDLRPLNPYTYHFMREIQGGLSGQLFAQLDYGKPRITGNLGLEGAQFLLPITKVKYALDQDHPVRFNPEEISVESLVITDMRYGTKAVAQGSFKHRNLADWRIQLHLDADSLFSLNTTRYDEDAYYGRAFATGTFDLKGTPLALTMDLDAKTNKGTSFHIPLTTASEVGQARFISFRPPPISLLEVADSEKERNKTTDIDMTFRIRATPDAEIELIFDPTVGDAIRARGTGELVMDMDREGAMDLWGSYTLKEGDYLFTLQNLINKKFIIRPGGTLTWEGDPYNAKIDMVARYPLRTSLNPLQISDTSRTKQRVLLDLGLTADLLQPKLNFNVLVPDAPTAVQEEVNTVLQSDQNEMNRQVFALLIMNSFLTPEYANRSAGTDFLNEGLTANTTEVLSNQLSRWVSQIDDRIDLGVNYQSGGVYEEQQIEVALSTQLFNDRVALNGNLGVPIGQEHTSTIVGDVEVEVLLSQDGQFRARAFNRSTQFDPLVSQYQYRQGVGVVFGTAFNSISELREKLFGGKN